MVKEGIRKLKFNQQLRKSEGSKIPKVELTISVDGVAIQEPKTKRILHQYPLHRISYCADDKGEKRFFSFIAKEAGDNEQHSCFVFVSKNLAEEITLTIGQAFDLAYKWVFPHIINAVVRRIELYLLKCYVYPSRTKKRSSFSCITQYCLWLNKCLWKLL